MDEDEECEPCKLPFIAFCKELTDGDEEKQKKCDIIIKESKQPVKDLMQEFGEEPVKKEIKKLLALQDEHLFGIENDSNTS